MWSSLFFLGILACGTGKGDSRAENKECRPCDNDYYITQSPYPPMGAGDIDAIQYCSHIGSNLTFSQVDLQGVVYPCLETVGGRLQVQLTTIENTDVFPNLRSAESISFYSNPALSGENLFPNLEQVGRIGFSNHRYLKTIGGFDKLEEIERLDISENDSLESIDAFQNVMTILSDLSIEENTALTSLSGLENLESVGTQFGEIRFQENLSLKEFRLDSLSYVGGDIEIRNNYSLEHISLPSLSEVYGDVDIRGNANLCQDYADDLVDQFGGSNYSSYYDDEWNTGDCSE